ncbi:GDSL-type esterase/lipase family protein [Ottowia thiooxydans]|uniref:GDSL-type esterase/lipase family protein n=1 Tax=Ottowia thiooxydans TaxID=219182 RepID=UPI0003F72574|nr:GDSL-type esterase/lipase family protein [Ottowia thiooxydans]
MNNHSLSRRHLLALVSMTTLLAACGKKSTPTARAIAAGSTVLALGDSLTSGVGTDATTAYPAVLHELTGWQVINGGVSGETSAQALVRTPALLKEHNPELVILSIGGNDFLRQMSAASTKENIRSICEAATASGAQALLVAVPQFSLLAASTGRLTDHPLYAELADELKLPLHQNGWAEVLADASLRSDQIHANAQGYRRFTEGLTGQLRASGLLAG